MTSYLKESLSVSIGCYGPTLMHLTNASNAFQDTSKDRTGILSGLVAG